MLGKVPGIHITSARLGHVFLILHIIHVHTHTHPIHTSIMAGGDEEVGKILLDWGKKPLIVTSECVALCGIALCCESSDVEFMLNKFN